MIAELRADLARLREEDPSTKALLRGVTSPSFAAIVVYRVFHALRARGIDLLPLRILVERFIEILSGIELPAAAEIGPGLRILHGRGLVVHPDTKVGPRCTLFHEVTLGGRKPGDGGPTIGANVVIGAGAKVLGNIAIGDGARIGANAVVIDSAPAGSTLVGVPARVVIRPGEIAAVQRSIGEAA